MKNLIRKSWLVLGLMTLAATAHADAGGDHGAGNGGDGLQLSSLSPEVIIGPPADVLLPPPADTRTYGNLRLEFEGFPRGERPDDVFPHISDCLTDSSGEIQQHGCYSYGTYVELPSRENRWPTGTYLVTLKGSAPLVAKVEENRETVVLVRKLTVRSDGAYGVHFAVFLDLSDSRMQTSILHNEYVLRGNMSFFDRVCSRSSLSPEDQKACRAYRSGTPSELLNTVMRFSSDGRYSMWQFPGWKAPEFFHPDYFTEEDRRAGSHLGGDMRAWARVWAHHQPKASGESVWVLPGVYGVVFRNTLTGRTQTQYGIVVE